MFCATQHKQSIIRIVLASLIVFASGQAVAAQAAEALKIVPGNYLDAPEAWAKAPAPADAVKLSASPGEYEPLAFALSATQAMTAVKVEAGPLNGPQTIPASALLIRIVTEQWDKNDHAILKDAEPADLAAGSNKAYWLTVHVPKDAKPGVYKGELKAKGADGPAAALALELTVHPIDLPEAPVALGFNYSRPKNPADMEAHLKDMREHGMTTVAPLYGFHLPDFDEDVSQFGEFTAGYKKMGFPGTLYWGATMGLEPALSGYGAIETARFRQKFKTSMRAIYQEVKKQGVPAIFSVSDELTNRGLPGVEFGERLTRYCYEQMPEIPITADSNGYQEVIRTAKYVNCSTFNNGWDGADHHNGGKHLLNKSVIEEVKATGSIPWFVNAQSGRFSFGFFFWKMSKLGVKGKVEWYWNLGNNDKGSVVFLDGAKIFPTLIYERSGKGVDDIRYLTALENLLAKAEGKPAAQAAAEKARGFLKHLDESVADDWNHYADGGNWWPSEQYDKARAKAVESILELQAALKRSDRAP